MDHHYVPQFYLRAFTDVNLDRGHEPYVWVADLRDRRIKRKAPKNIAKIPAFYTFPEFEATTGLTVESMHTTVESRAAPIIRRLLTSESAALENGDRADVLKFMAVLVTRSPYYRRTTEQLAASVLGQLPLVLDADQANRTGLWLRAVLTELLKAYVDHPEYFEGGQGLRLQIREGTAIARPDASSNSREGNVLRDRAGEFRGLAITQSFKAALEVIYPVFERLRWAVIRTSSERKFVTCDTPVNWIDRTLPRPRCFALTAPKTEVTLPIGPKTCLYGTWRGPSGPIEAGDEITEVTAFNEYNMRRVIFADRYVFADTEKLAREALEARAQIEDGSAATTRPHERWIGR